MPPDLPPESDRTIFTPPPEGVGPAGPALETAGDQIGPYRLLSPLGEGGFGTVWLAERRQPFLQKVALKIVKPGMDSKAVVARFEQERQALAVMNHPGVAKVLDGGLTPTGRPFFAMEFVQGEPLTLFCDRHRLPVKARLELFAQVCDAVQHAHTKGIIHRDLKPSNVLVALGDGDRPAPKVIDFGIAKAVTGRMTEQTVFTETGQMIGTPEYMSPEQADPGAVDVDTRTDVYSLGVMLYELLAGALPFDPKDLRSKAYREIQRVIREVDPPAPSVRLSTIATRDRALAERIGSARRETAGPLALTLRRELEWIPLKAMRKERQERYASPGDLALDVRNYLDGKPLVAAPESAAYRLRKFVRRNRVLVAGSAAVLGALVVGLGLATWQWREASRQRDAAEAARTEADAAKDRAVASETEAIREKEAAQLARDEAARERDAANAARDEANAAREETEENSYVANLEMAASWIEEGAYARARERLEACPPERRGFEWSMLSAEADKTLARFDLNGTPTRAVFTPDSRRVAVSGPNLGISVLDLARGDEVRGFVTWGRSDVFTLSPDGRRVAFVHGQGDPEVHEIDRQDWRPLFTLEGLGTGIIALAYSGDGTRIFAADPTGWHVRNATDGTPIATVRPAGGPFDSVSFSPDGSLAAAVRAGGTGVDIVDLMTGERRCGIDRDPDAFPLEGVRGNVRQVAWSPDARSVALVSDLSVARFHDVTDGSLRFEPKHHVGSGFAWSPDSRRIVFAAMGGLETVDATTGTKIARRDVNPDFRSESRPAFAPDGRRLYTLSSDGTIIVSDGTTLECIGTIAGAVPERKSWPAMVVSPDGLRGAVREDSAIRLVDLAETLPAATLAGTIVPSPKGDRAVSSRRTISPILGSPILGRFPPELVDVRTGRPIAPLEGLSGEIELAEFSPDGERVFTISKARAGRVHDARTGTLIAQLDLPTRNLSAGAFSPDGELLATGSRDGTVRLWNGRDGTAISEFPAHGRSILTLEFSPDGRLLVTGSDDRSARLWKPTSGEPVAEIAGHQGAVRHAAFSRDGRKLATHSFRRGAIPTPDELQETAGGKDATIRISSVPSGRIEIDLVVPDALGQYVTFDFSHDGTRGVIAGHGASASVRDLTDGSEILELRGLDDAAHGAGYTPDGSRLVTIEGNDLGRVREAVTGRPLLEFKAGSGSSGATTVRFMADGSGFVSIGSGGRGGLLVDAIPHRVRFAERRLRQQGQPADLATTYLRELRGETPRTWLSDPRLAENRPDFSSGPDDLRSRTFEDERILAESAERRRRLLFAARNEARWADAMAIALETDPGWMSAEEANDLTRAALGNLPPDERSAHRDGLLTLAELAVAKSGRKDVLALDTLSRVHRARGESERALAVVREAIALIDATPARERDALMRAVRLDLAKSLEEWSRPDSPSDTPTP